MTNTAPFGRRSTADQVLAGIDLTGRRILITGCNSGLGFESMSAFAANGATVIGLARSLSRAEQACSLVSPLCVPVACDLTDLTSVAGAARTVAALNAPLDAIVANAGGAIAPDLQIRYGVELQFLVNHLSHFALVNRLAPLVRDGTGRIVMNGGAGGNRAPAEGIIFDNLDGSRFYDPRTFFAQSKLANALYARELAQRLKARGIAVNVADPGSARTHFNGPSNMPARMLRPLARLWMKSAAQGAATQALLAAGTQAAGITAEYWADCKIASPSPLFTDTSLARRLWDVSEELVARQLPCSALSYRQAA